VSSSLQAVLTRIEELTPQPLALQATAAAGTTATSGTSGFSDALTLATTPTAPSSSTLSDQASTYSPAIDAAAQRYGLDPALLQSVIQQESGFNPNATSSAGAQGLMQLMPSTAASLGVTDPYDPVQSINGGARYLREELDQFGGNTSLALAAYNAGGGAVARYGGIPPYPETQNYVSEILGRYQQLVAARGSA
jgi:soluble lytic murein transglycosylase-like protein